MRIKFLKKSELHPRFITDAVSAIRGVIGLSCTKEDCDYSSSKHKAVIQNGTITISRAKNLGLTDSHLSMFNESKNTAGGSNAFTQEAPKAFNVNEDLEKPATSKDMNTSPSKTGSANDHESDDIGFIKIGDLDAEAKRTLDSKLKIVDIDYTIVDKIDKLTDNAAEGIENVKKESDPVVVEKETKKEEIIDTTTGIEQIAEIKDQFLDSGNTGFTV